jgi:hypothetical protein
MHELWLPLWILVALQVANTGVAFYVYRMRFRGPQVPFGREPPALKTAVVASADLSQFVEDKDICGIPNQVLGAIPPAFLVSWHEPESPQTD